MLGFGIGQALQLAFAPLDGHAELVGLQLHHLARLVARERALAEGRLQHGKAGDLETVQEVVQGLDRRQRPQSLPDRVELGAGGRDRGAKLGVRARQLFSVCRLARARRSASSGSGAAWATISAARVLKVAATGSAASAKAALPSQTLSRISPLIGGPHCSCPARRGTVGPSGFARSRVPRRRSCR